MDGAGKSPSRDRPRGGSSEGTEDTEGRHFRDRTRMEGKGMRWQIRIDRVVIVARDFVWLQPAIQTHDFFLRDVEAPLMVAPAGDRSQSSFFTEFLGSPNTRVTQLTVRRVIPNQIDPLEM